MTYSRSVRLCASANDSACTPFICSLLEHTHTCDFFIRFLNCPSALTLRATLHELSELGFAVVLNWPPYVSINMLRALTRSGFIVYSTGSISKDQNTLTCQLWHGSQQCCPARGHQGEGGHIILRKVEGSDLQRCGQVWCSQPLWGQEKKEKKMTPVSMVNEDQHSCMSFPCAECSLSHPHMLQRGQETSYSLALAHEQTRELLQVELCATRVIEARVLLR